ncbi:MAG: hypothetical protein HFE63_06300 [Clostridiales bacterium]|nr:hypothetical protein [Clostridiales bacterium]
MNSSAEIIDAGFACLVEKLGIINAERFITIINREGFDYTEWRRTLFDNMTVEKFEEAAVEYDRSHPYTGKGKRI